MTKLTRPVVRETEVTHFEVDKPLVIELCEGGKVVRTKIKGHKKWVTATYEQIHAIGLENEKQQATVAQ